MPTVVDISDHYFGKYVFSEVKLARYLLSLNSIESCLPSIQVIQIFEMLTSVDISDHKYGKCLVSISTSTFSTITLVQLTVKSREQESKS